MMNDLISRQAAVEAPEEFIKDCNPEHFVGHQKFIEYMDNAEIGSFGNWQFANGFNMGLTAAEVAIKRLPSAQQEITEKQVKEYCKKRCLIVLTSDAFYWLKSGHPERCEDCRNFNKAILWLKTTNADRIRTKTDKDLAEWLTMIERRAIEKAWSKPHYYTDEELKADWLDWLKQEAEE